MNPAQPATASHLSGTRCEGRLAGVVRFLALLGGILIVVPQPARASGRIALVGPISLQTLKTNAQAKQLNAYLVSAVNRGRGVEAFVVNNDRTRAMRLSEDSTFALP